MVTFHSQDDKAKVPIGLTAVEKLAPLVMHLVYHITSPDHDYVIAPNHKWAHGVVVSMFDFHHSDQGSNPARGGKIS